MTVIVFHIFISFYHQSPTGNHRDGKEKSIDEKIFGIEFQYTSIHYSLFIFVTRQNYANFMIFSVCFLLSYVYCFVYSFFIQKVHRNEKLAPQFGFTSHCPCHRDAKWVKLKCVERNFFFNSLTFSRKHTQLDWIKFEMLIWLEMMVHATNVSNPCSMKMKQKIKANCISKKKKTFFSFY